jgi:hypothetical protein
MGRRLHITCPDCATELVVDAATGEVLSHRAPRRAPAAGKDFDALLEGLDEARARAEAVFERERSALADRSRLLEEKFEEARKRAEEEGLEGPPERPWDYE